MPFPTGVGKLTFSGTHGSGEIWSFGFHMIPIVMTEGIMDDLEEAINGYFGATSWRLSGSARPTEIKYAQLDQSGHYSDDNQPFIREIENGTAGGGGASYLPQATVCITLGTGKKRGLAHAGRFYLPPTSLQAGNSGTIGETAQTEISVTTKNFLDVLNDAIAPAYLVVASSKGAGAINKVTEIRVGGVIDTQRRRRSALPESYVTTALTP